MCRFFGHIWFGWWPAAWDMQFGSLYVRECRRCHVREVKES